MRLPSLSDPANVAATRLNYTRSDLPLRPAGLHGRVAALQHFEMRCHVGELAASRGAR